MAKHSVQRKREKRGNGFSFGSAVVLVLCFIGVSFGLYLWQAAFSIGQPTPTVDDTQGWFSIHSRLYHYVHVP